MSRERVQSLAPIAVGLAAVVASLPMLVAPSSQFDAGIASSGATFTLHGLLPYRDYWLLYGPLAGFLLTPVTALLGPSLSFLQIGGLILVFFQALFAFLLVRRWTYPFAAVLIAVLAAVVPAALIGIEFASWSLAMTLALAAMWTLGREQTPAWVGGSLIGLTFLARLDVGGYALLAALLLRPGVPLLAGFGVVAGPFVILALATTKFVDLFEQVIWFPVVGQRQFRSLPGIDAEIPMLQARVVSIPLVLVPRVLIVASIVQLMFRRPVDRLALALTAFAVLCQFQTMARTDIHHFAQASTPAILLLGTFVRTRGLRSATVLGLSTAPLVAIAVVGLAAAGIRSADPRDDDLARSVSAVTAMTEEDEPIFAGLTAHRHAFVNPLVAYYLADRRPGTTQTLFNPGITNRDETQERMVRELIDSDTRVMILDDKFADTFEVYNDSRVPGSTILDEFIAERFAIACTFGDYRVMARRAADGTVPACPDQRGSS